MLKKIKKTGETFKQISDTLTQLITTEEHHNVKERAKELFVTFKNAENVFKRCLQTFVNKNLVTKFLYVASTNVFHLSKKDCCTV